MVKEAKRQKNLKRQDMITAYAMLAPALLVLLTFILVPLGMALQKSFYDWKFYGESRFIGLHNYTVILQNPYFRSAVVNVFKFVLILVPLQIVLSFLIASMLRNMTRRASNMTKILLYTPCVLSGVVSSMIFLFFLDYNGGLFNQFFKLFGFPRQSFLIRPGSAVAVICLIMLWLGLGYNTLVTYAGLLSIPDEFYEAAMVDGAGVFSRLFQITLPSMKNYFVLLSIGLVSTTLQMLEIPMILTNGGPQSKTLTPILYLFNNFRDMDKTMTYTITGAVLLMMVIAIINSFVFRVIKSEKLLDD